MLDESTLTQVTSSPGLDIFPSLSPDGSSIAYSSDQNGSFEIYVKSLTPGGREIQLTSDGGENLEPAWSPDGKLIAYYSHKRGGIWLIPALGGAARQLTDFGSRPAWSPDGSKIAFQSDAIHDLGQTAPTTPCHLPPSGLCRRRAAPRLSSRGQEILPEDTVPPRGRRMETGSLSAREHGIGGIWSVPVNGGEPQHSWSQRDDFNPVYVPGGQASTSREQQTILGTVASHLFARGHRARRPGDRQEHRASLYTSTLNFSADGRFMAYSAHIHGDAISGRSRISPVKAEAIEPPDPLTHDTNYRKSSPLFSSDGSKIAYFVSQIGVHSDIWMMSSDGKNPKPLAATKNFGLTVGWFPDGGRLAFVSTQEARRFLMALSTETGRNERLRELDRGDTNVRLSPDGKQIAFNFQQGGSVNIWTAPVEGGPPRQLTFDKESMGYPCWSPDGKFLAFEVKRGDDTNIGIVPSSGGTPILLTSDHGTSISFR